MNLKVSSNVVISHSTANPKCHRSLDSHPSLPGPGAVLSRSHILVAVAGCQGLCWHFLPFILPMPSLSQPQCLIWCEFQRENKDKWHSETMSHSDGFSVRQRRVQSYWSFQFNLKERNITKHFGLPGGLKRIRKARSVHVLLSHSGWMSEIPSLSRLRQQRIFFIDIHSRIALENSLSDNNA